MTRSTTAFAVLALMATALALSACSGAPSAKSKEPFALGVVTWVGIGPFYLARDKDLFGGLKVTIEVIDDAAGRRAALAHGSIQAMAATVDDFANAAAAGLPGTAILKTDDSFGGDGIVATPDIRTIADLKGKSVAFPQGMPSHFFLINALRQHGLSTSDLQVSYMEAGEAGAAFVAGKVDAAVTWAPWLSRAARRRGGGHVLLSTQATPGLISDIIVANRTDLAKRHADFEQLIQGWFAALDYMQRHQEESHRLMARSLSLTLDELQANLQGIRLTGRDENLKFFGLHGSHDEFARAFTAAGEIWKQERLVSRPVAPAGFVDASLLAALK
jgi:NitT/TauT family transport system substrate-binding protein